MHVLRTTTRAAGGPHMYQIFARFVHNYDATMKGFGMTL